MRLLIAAVLALSASAQYVPPATGGGGSLPSGLVAGAQAIYLFNEGTGTTVHDTSGNGYNCTVTGAVTWLLQGISMTINSEVDCPSAAFNSAGLIQIWMHATNTPNASNEKLLLHNSTGYYIQILAPNKLLITGSVGGNILADDISQTMSLSFTPSPFQAYINGGLAYGPIEAPVNLTWGGTGTTSIGFGGLGYTGQVYAIVAYPAGTYTQAQVAANDSYMWSLLSTKGVFPQLIPKSLPVHLYVGDSIPAGNNVNSYYQTYPAIAAGLLGESRYLYNLGQGGQTIVNALTNISLYERLVADQTASIVMEALGTNDVSASTAAATIVTNKNNFCAFIHSGGGGSAIGGNATAKCLTATLIANGSWTSPQLTIGNTVNSTIISNWLAGSLNSDWVVDFSNDPVMGNTNLTSNTTWFANVTHPTYAGYQLMAQRAAAASALATGRTPFWMNVVMPYQYFVAGSITSTTATVNLHQLGPGEELCGVTVNLTNLANPPIAYAGTGIATVTASIGDSTGTATQYLAATSLTSTIPVNTGFTPFGSANGIVQATFTSAVGNLNALTAGYANIGLCLQRVN